MAAIFQCKSVNIKENAIKNELIDLKVSRKRGMVFFWFSDKRGIFQLIFQFLKKIKKSKMAAIFHEK